MTNPADLMAQLLARPQPLRWVFAGDSITQGALHTFGWRDYVELFGERLRWEMQRRRDCVIKTAVSGWTLASILEDLEWSAVQHRPDVLLLMFGMNDCAAGAEGRKAFETAYNVVIERARAAMGPEALIVVQTPNRILPADVRRFPHLPEYACAAREAATRHGAVLIDHFADWEAADRNGSMAYWLSDSIHPNEIGHRAILRHLCRTLNMWDPASPCGRLFIA